MARTIIILISIALSNVTLCSNVTSNNVVLQKHESFNLSIAIARGRCARPAGRLRGRVGVATGAGAVRLVYCSTQLINTGLSGDTS